MAKKQQKITTLKEVQILIVAPFSWGIAPTLEGAIQNARKAGGIRHDGKEMWQAFICHKDTKIDCMGRCTFPAAFVPREITRKGIRPGKEIVTFKED